MGTDGTQCIQASRQGSQRHRCVSGLLLPPKGGQALPGIPGAEPEGPLHLTAAALFVCQGKGQNRRKVEGEKDLEGSQNPLPKRWRKTEASAAYDSGSTAHCLRLLTFKRPFSEETDLKVHTVGSGSPLECDIQDLCS